MNTSRIVFVLLLVVVSSACRPLTTARGTVVPPPSAMTSQHPVPPAEQKPPVPALFPPSPLPPPSGMKMTLEDEVRDLPDGRIAWSTYWKLCWEPYAGAVAYEMQTLTGEGTSRKLRRQHDTCLRIEAAAGENAKEKGLVNRDLLLALQSGQLAYRIRAVLDGDRVSEWSSVMMVGEVSK